MQNCNWLVQHVIKRRKMLSEVGVDTSQLNLKQMEDKCKELGLKLKPSNNHGCP